MASSRKGHILKHYGAEGHTYNKAFVGVVVGVEGEREEGKNEGREGRRKRREEGGNEEGEI